MRWNQRFNHYNHVKLNRISLTKPLVQIIFVVGFDNLLASIFGYNKYETRYFRSEEN
jgi:hypothetical protein